MTISINGVEYDALKMPPRLVLHVLRRLGPLLASIGPAIATIMGDEDDRPKAEVFAEVGRQMGPISIMLAGMEDRDLDYVLNACLEHARRMDGDRAWHPVRLPGMQLNQYQDIDAAAELRLAAEVIRVNSAGFFGLQGGAPASPSSSAAPGPAPSSSA